MDAVTTFERRTERGILAVVGAGALLVGGATLIFGASELIIDAVSGVTQLHLEVDQPLPGGIGDGDAILVDGAYDTAVVAAEGLSGGVVTLLTVGRAFGLLGDVSPAADPFFPLVMPIDPAPLGFGLAMLLIAIAFERGRRLQHDTEGLV